MCADIRKGFLFTCRHQERNGGWSSCVLGYCTCLGVFYTNVLGITFQPLAWYSCWSGEDCPAPSALCWPWWQQRSCAEHDREEKILEVFIHWAQAHTSHWGRMSNRSGGVFWPVGQMEAAEERYSELFPHCLQVVHPCCICEVAGERWCLPHHKCVCTQVMK